MKKSFKKLATLALCGSLLLSSSVSNAADVEYVDDISLGRCIQSGNLDFILFLNSTISSDGFQETLFEPWNDVLVRNQCQSADVLSLLQQRNKVRSIIRDAFLTCQKDSVPKLHKAFTKLNMEIYYVRHVVEGNIVANLPFQAVTTRLLEDPDSLFVDEEKLYSTMYNKYFDSDYFDKSEFRNQFELLQKKYDERKKSYIVCESSSWDEVSEKWDEFLESAAGVGEAGKDFKKEIVRSGEKIVEATQRASLDEYLGSVAALSINNLDPETGLDELLGSFPDFSPSAYDVLEASNNDSFRYSTEKLELDMRTRYSNLYFEGGDGAIQLFVDELESTNNVLKDSLKPIKAVEKCAESMNSKQCPGK